MQKIEIFGIPYLKKGSGIHIKKKNRGKFTEYCGGEVTDKCIQRAKNSKNPTLRKRATFAQNARGWAKKHAGGGPLEDITYAPNIKSVRTLSSSEEIFNNDNIRAGKGDFQDVLLDSSNKASDFMSKWYTGRKATGKFDEELKFIEDRAKLPTNIRGAASGSGGANYEGSPTGNFIIANPAVQKVNWGEEGIHRGDYVSRLIHEMAHAFSMYNKNPNSKDVRNYEASPTLKKLQSYMGDDFNLFPTSSEDTENSAEYLARLMQMREAMNADPLRTDYTEKELNPWLKKFGLPTGERGTWMMNNLVYNTPSTNDGQPKTLIAKSGIKLLPKKSKIYKSYGL